jgi:hypothetical protein
MENMDAVGGRRTASTDASYAIGSMHFGSSALGLFTIVLTGHAVIASLL